MLVLSRKLNESIMIDNQIRITVVDVRGDQVSIGISAPPGIKIYRSELWEAIRRENISSGSAGDGDLQEISRKFKKK